MSFLNTATRWLTVETRGERGRILAYAIIAMCGAAMSFVVVTGLSHEQRPLLAPLSGYELWVILAGVSGGAGGLYLTEELIGQPGRAGWPRAVIGVLMLSFSGSIIAGTVALPIYGTMFGPLSLMTTLAGAPVLAVVWIGAVFAAHHLMVRWREERESIFIPLDDLPRTPRPSSTSPWRKEPGAPMELREAEVRALLGLDERPEAAASAPLRKPRQSVAAQAGGRAGLDDEDAARALIGRMS